MDDMGTVFPDWDNGRGLGVVYGEDSFRKLTPEELLEEQQKENMDEDMNMGNVREVFKMKMVYICSPLRGVMRKT